MHITEQKPTNELKAEPLAMRIDKQICKHDIAPFPNRTGARVLVVGQPGAGKTALTLNAIKNKRLYKKCFNNVYVLAPENSVNSIKDSLFDGRKLHPDRVIHEFDGDTLDDLLAKLEASKEEDQTNLVIIDDWASSLKEREIEKRLNHIAANARHLNLVLFILVQSFRFVPKKTRTMCSDVVLVGQPKNKMEIKTLGEEVFFLEPSEVKQMMKFVFRSKHDFLWVRGNGDYYRNYNKLDIDGE